MIRAKEIHFIDTSPFISVIKRDENRQMASRYFARLRAGVYQGYITLSVYAEVISIIRRDIKREKWIVAMNEFLRLVDDNNIELRTPRNEDVIENLTKIKDLEPRIGHMDAKLLAEAISLKIPYFATLDTKLGEQVNAHGKRLIKIKVITQNIFK